MSRKRKAAYNPKQREFYTPSMLKRLKAQKAPRKKRVLPPVPKPYTPEPSRAAAANAPPMTKDMVPGAGRKRRTLLKGGTTPVVGTHSSGTLIPKQKDVSAKAAAGASARKTKRIGTGSGRAVLPKAGKVVKKAKGMIGVTQGKTQTAGGRQIVKPKRRVKTKPLSPRRKK